MARFAAETDVSPEKSRSEIERIVRRYGADSFGFVDWREQAIIQFSIQNRRVRFTLNYPSLEEFDTTLAGRYRSAGLREKARQAEIRRRWRSLVMAIKSKLDIVESGIETFEEAFMAEVVLSNGRTVAEEIGPKLVELYGPVGVPQLARVR